MPATSMPATLTFESVAKEIIKETISNALFVDDKALEPFKSKSKKLDLRVDHERSLQLYKDFKSHDCLLHTAKFTKAGWNRDRKFNLNNKDLIILDWQLVRDDHQEALKILDDSVLKKGIHFVCIYTQASLQEVRNELTRYYLGKVHKEKVEEIRSNLRDTELDEFWNLELEDEDWINFDTLINSIVNARSTEIEEEVKEFKDALGLSDENIDKIKLLDSDVRLSFIKLRSALNKTELSFSKIIDDEFVFRPSQIDNNTFYINHTIVKLFEKNSLSGNQLYDAFVDSILKERNIFLTLMGLEMRNRFRENSAFIGKDLDNISEEAFFYHKNYNTQHPELFTEFLRDILKDQVASFLYEKDLKIFSVLEEYYDSNDGNNKQAQFIIKQNEENFLNEVYRLNSFYNRLNINHRKQNDSLRFGDVFYSNIDGKEDYYMCITPHCDCLNPSKLKNQFWFVKGKKAEPTPKARKNALDGADGKHLSFVAMNSSVECVYWANSSLECKPFAFHVPNNKITNGKLTVKFNGEELQLEFIDSIKENYAQRIANHAAGYSLRVGIDFVKK